MHVQILQPASGCLFSLEVVDIPKVNCPDYTCTGGVIVWVNMAGRQKPTPSTTNVLSATGPLPVAHIYSFD